MARPPSSAPRTRQKRLTPPPLRFPQIKIEGRPPTAPAGTASPTRAIPTHIHRRVSHLPVPPIALKKPHKTNHPEASNIFRPHTLRRSTEWLTVPGRIPTQPGTLLSLAPVVLFGSRFSSEEKWDRKKGKNPQRKQEEGVVKETEREPRLRISQENSLLSKRSKLTNQKTHEDTTKAVAVYRLQRLLYWKSRLVCVLLFLKRLAQTLVIG